MYCTLTAKLINYSLTFNLSLIAGRLFFRNEPLRCWEMKYGVWFGKWCCAEWGRVCAEIEQASVLTQQRHQCSRGHICKALHTKDKRRPPARLLSPRQLSSHRHNSTLSEKQINEINSRSLLLRIITFVHFRFYTSQMSKIEKWPEIPLFGKWALYSQPLWQGVWLHLRN